MLWINRQKKEDIHKTLTKKKLNMVQWEGQKRDEIPWKTRFWQIFFGIYVNLLHWIVAN